MPGGDDDADDRKPVIGGGGGRASLVSFATDDKAAISLGEPEGKDDAADAPPTLSRTGSYGFASASRRMVRAITRYDSVRPRPAEENHYDNIPFVTWGYDEWEDALVLATDYRKHVKKILKRPNRGEDYHYALDGFRALAYLWFLGTRVTQAMTDLDDHYRRSDFYQHPGVVFRLAMTGDFALTIFMVLTGYLMTMSTVRHVKLSGSMHWGVFCFTRFLRVWPMLILSCTLLVVVHMFRDMTECNFGTWGYWSNWLLIANYVDDSCEYYAVSLEFQVGLAVPFVAATYIKQRDFGYATAYTLIAASLSYRFYVAMKAALSGGEYSVETEGQTNSILYKGVASRGAEAVLGMVMAFSVLDERFPEKGSPKISMLDVCHLFRFSRNDENWGASDENERTPSLPRSSMAARAHELSNREEYDVPDSKHWGSILKNMISPRGLGQLAILVFTPLLIYEGNFHDTTSWTFGLSLAAQVIILTFATFTVAACAALLMRATMDLTIKDYSQTFDMSSRFDAEGNIREAEDEEDEAAEAAAGEPTLMEQIKGSLLWDSPFKWFVLKLEGFCELTVWHPIATLAYVGFLFAPMTIDLAFHAIGGDSAIRTGYVYFFEVYFLAVIFNFGAAFIAHVLIEKPIKCLVRYT